MPSATPDSPLQFIDRRTRARLTSAGAEDRRQFSNSYADLSVEARELASAIDHYKFRHRRRFINYEEMLAVIKELGYQKTPASAGD